MIKPAVDFQTLGGFSYSGDFKPDDEGLDFTTTLSSARSESGNKAFHLLELWQLHSGSLWENGRHKETCRAFIEEIGEYMLGAPASAIDDGFVDGLIAHYRKKGNRNSTINRKLAALFKLLKRAERAGQITRLPTYLRLRERNSRVRFLTSEEEEKLFSTIAARNSHHGLLCQFLVDTGARIGEALAVKWADIHNGAVTFWITKSGKSRTVPLTIPAKQSLEAARRLGGSGPFTAIEYQNFMYNWNRARKQCGFTDDPYVVPHILRHTCASRLVQAGIDLRRVQTFLGHQTIQMTLRYAHLATNDLDQCAVALDTLNAAAIAAE